MRRIVQVLSLVCLLFVAVPFTTSSAQEPDKETLTLNLKEVTVEQLFKTIEQNSSYTFQYRPDDLDDVTKRFTLQGTIKVPELLSRLLKNTPLSFSIKGNVITITSNQSHWTTVRGKILDSNGEPIPGAYVRLKGKNKGTTSDADGNYKIRLESLKDAVLVYSFIGMATKELQPKGKVQNVTLNESSYALEGVVVESTGYQDTDKRLSTSSVVTVKAADLIVGNVGTLDNMFLGKIPGMNVITDVSTPGAAAKIRVRGVSTISGNREPLWVVDGIILDDPVPISAEELNSLDNVNLIGNAISGLNPLDIEKVDILKDAAATAIYGVRAANGVIVVTTKKGKEGRMRINYSGTFTYNQRPNYGQMSLMNSKERIEVSKEIEERALPFAFQVSRVGYEGALMDLYDRNITQEEFLERVKVMEENNTDWFGVLFRDNVSRRHNLSLSGGAEKYTYYISGNYRNNPDVVKGKGVKNYSTMMKLNFHPTKTITGMVSLRVSGNDKEYTHNSFSPYQFAMETARTIPAYDENGDPFLFNRSKGRNSQLLFSPLHEMAHSGNTVKTNSYNITAQLNWRPITDLTLSTTMGYNYSATSDKSWFDEQSYAAAQLRMLNYGVPLPDQSVYREDQAKLPYGGELRSNNMHSMGWQWRAQVIYNWRPWENHTITFNVGPEFRSSRYNGLRSTEFGYLPDRGESFMYINPKIWEAHRKYAENYPDVVTNRLSNFISLFANITYSYQRKYILTYNMRAEGSNKFGQDKRARFLPIWSLSGRWNLQEEPWLKDVMWLNMLSLKTSFGLQGNVSDEQTPQLIMRYGKYNDIAGKFTSYITKLPNPSLRWEKNTSYNVGLETSMFDNRFYLSLEYYQRKGTDQLIQKSVSQTLGRSSIQVNAGTLINEGMDVMMTLVPIRQKDWTWTINLNGSHNRNKVLDGGINTEYTYQQYLNGTAIINGKSINSFYSYRFKGLTEEGKPDFNGLEYGKAGLSKEEFYDKIFVESGDRIPFFQGGFGTSLRWKDLTLNLFFSYSVGNKVRLNNLYRDYGQQTPQPWQNMNNELVDRWRKPGDEAHTNIPALSADPMDDVLFKKLSFFGGNDQKWDYSFANNRWQMYNKSDIRVVDGSNIRLRTASLSYNVPTKWIEKMGLSAANVRLEGYNLLLFSSKKLRGQDPSQMSLGLRTTPPLPSYSFTVNLSF